MKTLILDLKPSQISVFIEMAKALKISYTQINEEKEDKALYKAMLDAKKSGHLTTAEKSAFIDGLGK